MVISLWVSLTKYQTITFIMNISDKVPWPTPVYISLLKFLPNHYTNICALSCVLHFQKQWENSVMTLAGTQEAQLINSLRVSSCRCSKLVRISFIAFYLPLNMMESHLGLRLTCTFETHIATEEPWGHTGLLLHNRSNLLLERCRHQQNLHLLAYQMTNSLPPNNQDNQGANKSVPLQIQQLNGDAGLSSKQIVSN